ncbi:hypothetical protein TNCV_369461 [Trichonephila clavipes]|nr:hypothetical protein TNCV_369461 [Trichonephila clavipes]
MATERAGLVICQAKPVEVCSQKIMSSGQVGNSFGSLQVPRDWTPSGQSFPWLSKALSFLGLASTIVYV